MKSLFCPTQKDTSPKDDIKPNSGGKINIEKLKECLTTSLQSIGNINNERDDLVMMVGLTGAGKSTTINYFLGWELGLDKDRLKRESINFLDIELNRKRLAGWEFISQPGITNKQN